VFDVGKKKGPPQKNHFLLKSPPGVFEKRAGFDYQPDGRVVCLCTKTATGGGEGGALGAGGAFKVMVQKKVSTGVDITLRFFR